MKITRIFAAMALAVAALSLGGCIEQSHKQTVRFTVESKERKCDGSSDGGTTCYYMVYGTNGEVFRNEDAVVFGDRWKNDSASMQARLHVGSTYDVETIGWRNPWFSMFPNIIRATPVPTPEVAGDFHFATWPADRSRINHVL